MVDNEIVSVLMFIKHRWFFNDESVSRADEMHEFLKDSVARHLATTERNVPKSELSNQKGKKGNEHLPRMTNSTRKKVFKKTNNITGYLMKKYISITMKGVIFAIIC